MRMGGFSIVELLVAVAIASLLVGALLSALAPARASFEAAPAALELQHRSRIGLEFLASSLRSAGAREGGNGTLSIAGAIVPALMPLSSSSGNSYSEFEVFAPAIAGARGVLDRDQPSPGSPVTLRAGSGCPQTPDVCGFMPRTIGTISDGQGRFDIFEVGSTDAVRMMLIPNRPLSASYAAGAQVLEIEAFRYALALQADGSKVLLRTTSARAAQPIVDGVTDLSLTLWGEAAAPRVRWDGTTGWSSYGPAPPLNSFRDGAGEWPDGESCVVIRDTVGPRSRLSDLGVAGTLVQLSGNMLMDGPWCAAGDRGYYDADLLRLRRIDVSIRLEAIAAALRGPVGQLFSRPGSPSASPMRWVPDRLVASSISLRHQP